MKKRLLVAACICACAGMLLTACGSKNETSAPASEAAETEAVQETDVVLDGTDADNDMMVSVELIDEIRARGYMIVGCKMDVPELSFYDEETDSWSGLEIDLAYESAAQIFDVSPDEAREQKLVQFAGVTVADREEKLASGAIDLMLATYTITEERAEKFALSDSYYLDYIGIMVLDKVTDADTMGNDGITSIADLDGKYIGVPRNATTREHFLNYIETMNTIKVSPIFCEYEGYEILYKALQDGNIDAIAVDISILGGYDDDTTVILDDHFAGQHYGAAVRKEDVTLLDYVNAAIAEH